MNEIPRIGPLRGPDVPDTPDAAPGPSPSEVSPRFQELLERLQRLAAEQPKPGDVDSPEQLRDALRTADDGFVAAMDLRKQLEAAFRRHLS